MFAASFLDEGEIDKFMIHVIPKFIGEGISLFALGRRNVPLKLISCSQTAWSTCTMPSASNSHWQPRCTASG